METEKKLYRIISEYNKKYIEYIKKNDGKYVSGQIWEIEATTDKINEIKTKLIEFYDDSEINTEKIKTQYIDCTLIKVKKINYNEKIPYEKLINLTENDKIYFNEIENNEQIFGCNYENIIHDNKNVKIEKGKKYDIIKNGIKRKLILFLDENKNPTCYKYSIVYDEINIWKKFPNI